MRCVKEVFILLPNNGVRAFEDDVLGRDPPVHGRTSLLVDGSCSFFFPMKRVDLPASTYTGEFIFPRPGGLVFPPGLVRPPSLEEGEVIIGEVLLRPDECFMPMDEPLSKLSDNNCGALSPCATRSRLRGAMRCEPLGVEVREQVVEFALRLLRCQSSKLGSWDGDARL